MAKSKKQQNEQMQASLTMRQLFSRLTVSRQHAREWEAIANTTKDSIKELAGATDVTYVSPSGEEVGSINESEPRQIVDYRAIVENAYVQSLVASNPKLADVVAQNTGEFKTTVTVLSKWVESDPKTNNDPQTSRRRTGR